MKKKLVEGQQFKTSWGIWVYGGLALDWECSKCGRIRMRCHEFLGYKNPEEAVTNPDGFNYHEMFGTECAKKFLSGLQSNLEIKEA